MVLILLVPFANALALAQDTSVSLKDMTAWSIVCDDASTDSEKFAATEFQRLYHELMGVTLPMVEVAASNASGIYIGPDAVSKAGLPPLDDPGEETLRIIVQENKLCIDGGRPRGTLYGVYEFFEELCGARFLTADHTYFPSEAWTISIPFGEHVYTPPFAFRWSYYGETNRQPEFAARLRVNTVGDDPKLGGRTGYRLVGHNVAYLVPPSTFGADHPEYYALVDGQRKLDMPGGGPQLCMTNPELVDIVVEAVLKEIEKNPDARNINVAHMDNQDYCTCENCAAVDAREESHAGATLAFVNAVAERVSKTHPDVLIGTYAYQYTRKPPKTLRAHPNVMIQLCSIECCDFHAINDPACSLNREFCSDMDGWKPKADHIFVWHYNTNFRGYLLPFPNFRSIGKSVDYFRNNNGQGVFMQAAGNGYSSELSDLRNYVMARCLWKPGRDSWAEMEEFCRLHYAEAAQPIIDYLTDYHSLIESKQLHPTCFPTESALAIDRESSRRILDYFEKAAALAQSDAIRRRVEKASLCAYRAVLSGVEMKLVFADGVCRPDLTGLDPGLLNRYRQLCTTYDVAMEDEHTTNEAYLAELEKLHAGINAAMVENEFWRVIVLPELNGKLAELTYKPANRNVAYANRGFKRFRFEDWVRQGQGGPQSQNIVAFETTTEPKAIVLTHTTEDGTAFRRSITLKDEAVEFAISMTAGADRIADFYIHPEYDAATFSDSAQDVGLYVKSPEWVHANADWKHAIADDEETALIKNAASGGAFAYFSREANFGIEQRFDPATMQSLVPFWSPSRRQVNLEMFPFVRTLAKGETAECRYEVRFLAEPPAK
ncbi:MAG: hypothetical protein AMXMBFR84_44790 [Candidatus Hydrogenedentota bacterium]